MTKNIALLAIGTLVASSSAFAVGNDIQKRALTCTSQDQAVTVTIDVGGFAGTVAKVYRGKNRVGTFLGVVGNRGGMQESFVAKNFQLLVTMESAVATKTHPATLKADLGQNGRLAETLICR